MKLKRKEFADLK
jgi:hypothetical protein